MASLDLEWLVRCVSVWRGTHLPWQYYRTYTPITYREYVLVRIPHGTVRIEIGVWVGDVPCFREAIPSCVLFGDYSEPDNQALTYPSTWRVLEPCSTLRHPHPRILIGQPHEW